MFPFGVLTMFDSSVLGRTSSTTIVGVPIELPDLVDSHEVAEVLGLSSHRSVSTYRTRHADFPAPIVEKGAGRCLLWLRADVEAWARSRG